MPSEDRAAPDAETGGPDEQQPPWIPQVAGVLTRVQEALELAGSAAVILGA